MAIQAYHLAHEFMDATTERSVLASLVQQPQLYWKHLDLLDGAFAVEQETWSVLASAAANERPCACPEEWSEATDLEAAVRRLADLRQRRMLADLQEKMALALRSPSSAQDVLQMLEEEVARTHLAVRETTRGKLTWAHELVADYIEMAQARQKLREETGSAISGIRSGLSRLDELLNGFGTGLYILAGAPGAGKTTLSLQFALQAARNKIPAVYVTYENSPTNLAGKALCSTAGVSAAEIERGFGNMAALRAAEYELGSAMQYLAIVEGTTQLTVADVKAKALQALHRHSASRCLIVFDYLQRAAHSKGFEGLRQNVSAMSGELRDLANRLQSPVLALSSQSRAGGNYGIGGGSATLDSLKESGDLEYSADAVMFLKMSPDRTVVPPARAVDIVVAKNRFGEVGTIPLIFRADLGRLRQEY